MKYYLVGIKGAGMSGMAKLLLSLGNEVSGVDYEGDFYTSTELSKIIKIEKFSEVVLDDSFFYVIGNVFKKHELTRLIIKKGMKYAFYPQLIDSLFKIPKVAISGTHGKTTITKIISDIARDDCAFLYGDGSGGSSKNNSFFIFEACEYKNTFLNYHPQILIVNNIDYDHPDFFKGIDDVFESFNELSQKSEILIYNGDDRYAAKLESLNKISFGLNQTNDVWASFVQEEKKTRITIHFLEKIKEFVIPFVGTHMVYNFLASFTTLRILGYSDEKIQSNINNISLPKRRLQTTIVDEKIMICDYAHHPTELGALYDSVNRLYNDYKKIIVFQSHTNSRTNRFMPAFKKALEMFDEIYLVDIFTSVREEGSETNDAFLSYMGVELYNSCIIDRLLVRNKCVICFAGAGNIDKYYEDFIQMLGK